MSKYECKHAYDAEGVRYISCDLEPKPEKNNSQSIFHSLCAFQRFCPDNRCSVLTAEYATCKKEQLKAEAEKPVVVEEPKKVELVNKSVKKKR